MTAITTAVRLLREAATELKKSHTLNGDWGNEHDALTAYNAHIAAAADLERIAPQCLAQIQEPAAVAGPADMRNALRWAAGGLRAVADDNDTLRIGSETRTVGEVLDAANAALEPAAPALEAPAAPVAPAPKFDLRTSAGGRGYVAWYFANVLKRHDFHNYIHKTLAADFACALAPALEAPAAPAIDVSELAISVCQRVAELPDRNSPEDWPDAMLVTIDELGEIVRDEIMQALNGSLAAAPQAPAEAQAAPVAGQCRFKGEQAWGNCSVEHVRMILQNPSKWQSYEVRYLYAAPQAPAAPVYPAKFGPDDWIMVVAGIPVKLDEWSPGAVKARTIYGTPAVSVVDAETIHLQDLKNALAECKELRQQLTLMDEQQAGTVWRWQADGQDKLETMGNRMGVLIYACDLRALLAGAAPAVDASPLLAPETELDAVVRDAEQIIRDADHYRFIKRHRLILSGGTETFGWPIAPFGDECDRYIAKELAAERAAAAQAAAKGDA